jgi:hypothetical protein
MKHASLGLAVAFSLVSSTAFAQSDKGYQSQDEPGGYKVIFRDDPLAAGGIDPNSGLIHVRKGAMRETLIRPRTSFVSEMLKSVENL